MLDTFTLKPINLFLVLVIYLISQCPTMATFSLDSRELAGRPFSLTFFSMARNAAMDLNLATSKCSFMIDLQLLAGLSILDAERNEGHHVNHLTAPGMPAAKSLSSEKPTRTLRSSSSGYINQKETIRRCCGTSRSPIES